MERKNLSDLPADLQKSISDFRNIAPGHHVVREAFARIYRLKSEESRQPAKALLERSKISKSWNDKLSLNIGLTWVFAVAAVLIALASVQQWAEQPLRPVKYIHNVAVNLATSSKGLFSFDLLMHHHRGRETQLEIKAPAHVKVDPGKLLMASRCSQNMCIHSVDLQNRSKHTVNFAVTSPGKHVIRLRHKSTKAHVEQHLVVYAQL